MYSKDFLPAHIPRLKGGGSNLGFSQVSVLCYLHSAEEISNSDSGSKSMKKLETAVRGKKGTNLDDLPHLDQFVHTGRLVSGSLDTWKIEHYSGLRISTAS